MWLQKSVFMNAFIHDDLAQGIKQLMLVPIVFCLSSRVQGICSRIQMYMHSIEHNIPCNQQ